MSAAIDASRTIAELIRDHEETRSVFLRSGVLVDGLAERSLAEVCAQRGLDLGVVLRELSHAIEESEPFEHGGFEWDAKHGVVRISPSVGAMLGRVELTSSPSAILAHIHPDDRERVRLLFRSARGHRHAFSFEFRLVRRDATRICAVQAEPIEGTRFIGAIWDITTQHGDVGRLLRATLDATADGLLVIDRTGNITTYNQRFVSMWGIPNELVARGTDEVLLRYVLDQLEEPRAFLAGVHTLYVNPERESFDVLRFKDGRVFERYSRPQRVAFAIVGRVWSFRDVTERERVVAGNTLLVDASRLLASMDTRSALDAVVHVAMETFGDAAALEVFGEPPIVASQAVDPAAGLPPVWPAEVRAGHTAISDSGLRLAVPLLGRDAVVGAIGFTASARRSFTRADLELAERLAHQIVVSIENARLYDRARAALRARDEFLAIAAHELRGPLSTLNLAVQTLAQRDVPEPTRERMLRLVEREGQRLRRFADDISDITQARAGTLAFADTPIDLLDVARTAVARLEPDIRRSGSTVSIATTAPVLGVWDRDRLEEVVTNLVANALKYGLGRPIEVSVAGNDSWATLVVADHGLGVPVAQRDAIFQPFERAVPVRHYGGLGLGLFIVRTIVARYGGTVHVESREDSGSRFVVRLPQRSAPS